MPGENLRSLVKEIDDAAQGRLLIAVQVSDNSAARILANMENAAKDGADIAIIAPPYFMMNAQPERIYDLYREAAEKSPLPVGIYDRGRHGAVVVPKEILESIYGLPNVVLVKDSSSDASRREIAIKAREQKPDLKLLNGDEFSVLEYAEAGYDGVMLGGAVLTGYMVRRVLELVSAGDMEEARQLDARTQDMLYRVYGGKSITCWLSGLKRALVELGVFSTWRSYLDYPLNEECVRNIKQVVAEEAEWLRPEKELTATR